MTAKKIMLQGTGSDVGKSLRGWPVPGLVPARL